MTIKIYMGTASDIINRLIAPPNNTTTTLVKTLDAYTIQVASSASFSVGSVIDLYRQRYEIESIAGSFWRLKTPMLVPYFPLENEIIRHYNADVTEFRDQQPLSFLDDLNSGAETGNGASKDLGFTDGAKFMPVPKVGFRVSVFDDVNPLNVLFGGSVVSEQREFFTKRDSSSLLARYTLLCRGYQYEADERGLDESPVYNINLGVYLKRLMTRYTNLIEGEIDTINSPTISFIRFARGKSFSDAMKQMVALWPEGEAFILNDHVVGGVYFRRKVEVAASFAINTPWLGDKGATRATITHDLDKTFNIVRYPFFYLQNRDTDFFVQSVVADNAFLKTTVLLSGQPANVEESTLLLDDFSGQEPSSQWLHYDISNPSPPAGYTASDGYMLTGSLNNVRGLHFLDAGSAVYGDIGLVTDPAETLPVTGAERQLLFCEELVINTLGDAWLFGIIDQTTFDATVLSGSTSAAVKVDNPAYFVAGDRVDWQAEKSYVTSVAGDTVNVSPAFSSAPSATHILKLHPLAKSRVRFAIETTTAGNLRQVVDGVSSAFTAPRTYTTATYALRAYFKAFQTTVTAATGTSATLADASEFASGDWVELYTAGSMNAPEVRQVTKSGSVLSYAATTRTPLVGYAVKALPRLVLEIKGGAYGLITGRDWTELYKAPNTWRTSYPNTTIQPFGFMAGLAKTLVASVSLVKLKNPPALTALVGSRYLHVGSQEIDSSDLDIDCIVRKLGTHYQLDFFPDTKALWGSGQTLEVKYQEKKKAEVSRSDTDSMRAVAEYRGVTIAPTATQEELERAGGRALPSVELSPYPITLQEAGSSAKALLEATKSIGVKAEIRTVSVLENIVRAGQIIRTDWPEAPTLVVQRVQLEEVRGAQNTDGTSIMNMSILAGTVDRASDFFNQRKVKANNRLVIDDGASDDSITRITQADFSDSVTVNEAFAFSSCNTPSKKILTSTGFAKIRCLRVF
jgi:hypothetical protein